MNNLLIYGPPASGKSFLAKCLSKQFNKINYFDLDEQIEQQIGSKIKDVMTMFGQTTFRKIEKDIFKDLVSRKNNSIISLGGGTLLDEDSRKLAEKENIVLCLNQTNDILERNFFKDLDNRPLCNNIDTYQKLLLSRKSHYLSFSIQITNIFLDPDKTHQNGLSNIISGINLISLIPILIKILFPNSKIHVIYDSNVKFIAKQITENISGSTSTKIKASEKNKNLNTVYRILNDFKKVNLNRNDIVISLGGGITSDITGFASSQWKRGIKWINVPTTLLSMVDASVGGKTGVNFKGIKNLIGSFYKPSFVFIDPTMLQTLNQNEMKNGYAEAYKHFLIDSTLNTENQNFVVKLLSLLNFSNNDNIIESARFINRILETKLKIVKIDPFEIFGFREKLNLGHTIAHAIESISKNKISHGNAVAIGLYHETLMSQRNGILKDINLSEKIKSDLEALGLPVCLPYGISEEKLIKSMQFDKKNNDNRIKFVILENIGSVKDFYL